MVAPEMWMKTGRLLGGPKEPRHRAPDHHRRHPVGLQARLRARSPSTWSIIDEAHMIPPDGDGMYRTFLEDARKVNPNLRVIGLTATPFRMKSGMICEPDNVLNHVCYEIGVKELIVQGYLCPLVTKAKPREGRHLGPPRARRGVRRQRGRGPDGYRRAGRVGLPGDRRADAGSAGRCSSSPRGSGTGSTSPRCCGGCRARRSATVFGETADEERDRVLAEFKAGQIKYLVNVNVLTTGFDAPNIDCVAMVRPTLSPGLYYQMVGRGFRLNAGKENCLVLDFGGNVLRHGPVDAIRIQSVTTAGSGEAPAKECPECRSLIAAGYSVCPDCGYEFPPPERRNARRDRVDGGHPLGRGDDHGIPECPEVRYCVHHEARSAAEDAPRTLRVEYQIGFNQYQSEWICFEHTGWARQKAESWWRKRSNAPVPESAEEAVTLAQAGALCQTGSITVRSVVGEEYAAIIGYELGEKPAWREPGWDEDESGQIEPNHAHAGPVAAMAAGNEDIPF